MANHARLTELYCRENRKRYEAGDISVSSLLVDALRGIVVTYQLYGWPIASQVRGDISNIQGS